MISGNVAATLCPRDCLLPRLMAIVLRLDFCIAQLLQLDRAALYGLAGRTARALFSFASVRAVEAAHLVRFPSVAPRHVLVPSPRPITSPMPIMNGLSSFINQPTIGLATQTTTSNTTTRNGKEDNQKQQDRLPASHWTIPARVVAQQRRSGPTYVCAFYQVLYGCGRHEHSNNGPFRQRSTRRSIGRAKRHPKCAEHTRRWTTNERDQSPQLKTCSASQWAGRSQTRAATIGCSCHVAGRPCWGAPMDPASVEQWQVRKVRPSREPRCRPSRRLGIRRRRHDDCGLGRNQSKAIREVEAGPRVP
jgi:hypothetical protein